MRIAFLLFVFAISVNVASADNGVVISTTTTSVYVSAQEHADDLARRGAFGHCKRHGARYEGIGMGSTPEAAKRNCCYWGRRPLVEVGVSYSPIRRAYIAVARYR